MRMQFGVHPERCVGCGACVLACMNEQGLGAPEQIPLRKMCKNEYIRAGRVEIVYYTYACMHCADAPCAAACPKGCFTRDEEHGLTVLDASECIGCRACARACPYDAVRFNAVRRAVKCDGCAHLVGRGQAPMCVQTCPRRAITIDEKNDVLQGGRKALKEEMAEHTRQTAAKRA